MKIATFNVNEINGRLAVLLRWLAEAKPDIVCLQELKAPRSFAPAARLVFLTLSSVRQMPSIFVCMVQNAGTDTII